MAIRNDLKIYKIKYIFFKVFNLYHGIKMFKSKVPDIFGKNKAGAEIDIKCVSVKGRECRVRIQTRERGGVIFCRFIENIFRGMPV